MQHDDEWLTQQIAAAEKRGAARALREAADDTDGPDVDWLRDRADRIENGVHHG